MNNTPTIVALETADGDTVELQADLYALLLTKRGIDAGRLVVIDGIPFAHKSGGPGVCATPVHVLIDRAIDAAAERDRRARIRAEIKARQESDRVAIQARIRESLSSRAVLKTTHGACSTFQSALASSTILPVSRYPLTPIFPRIGPPGRPTVRLQDGSAVYPGPRQFKGNVFIVASDEFGNMVGTVILPLNAFRTLESSEWKVAREVWRLGGSRILADTRNGVVPIHDLLTAVGCAGTRVLLHRLGDAPLLVGYDSQPTSIEVRDYDLPDRALRHTPAPRRAAQKANESDAPPNQSRTSF